MYIWRMGTRQIRTTPDSTTWCLDSLCSCVGFQSLPLSSIAPRPLQAVLHNAETHVDWLAISYLTLSLWSPFQDEFTQVRKFSFIPSQAHTNIHRQSSASHFLINTEYHAALVVPCSGSARCPPEDAHLFNRDPRTLLQFVDRTVISIRI